MIWALSMCRTYRIRGRRRKEERGRMYPTRNDKASEEGFTVIHLERAVPGFPLSGHPRAAQRSRSGRDAGRQRHHRQGSWPRRDCRRQGRARRRQKWHRQARSVCATTIGQSPLRCHALMPLTSCAQTSRSPSSRLTACLWVGNRNRRLRTWIPSAATLQALSRLCAMGWRRWE